MNSKIEHVYGSVIAKENIIEFCNSYKRSRFKIDGAQEGFNNSIDYFKIQNQKEVILVVSEGVKDHGRYAYGGYSDKGMVIPNARLIWYNVFYAYLNKSFTSIKIIEEERKDNASSCALINCDYLYVLGFGFDVDNMRQINLDSKICNKQIFVTNYKGNQKIERMILNLLSKSTHNGNRFIPIISHYGVNGALSEDFSLLEEPEITEKIPLDKSLNGGYSPFIGYKSSLYSLKTHNNNQNHHDQNQKN